MRLRRHDILWVVILFLGLGVAWAQEFQVESSVDRTEIAAGESVVLSLTVTQSLQGMGPTLNMPRIPPMEGLDIVSQRSAQNMNIINGVGYIQVQTVAEILPKAPGTYTIPGFSLKGPDGKIHTTKPITIKVTEPKQPAAEEEPSAEAPANSDDPAEKPAGVSLITGLLIILGIVALVVLSPLAISWFMARSSGRPRTVEAELVNPARPGQAANGKHPPATNGGRPNGAATPNQTKPAAAKPAPVIVTPAAPIPVDFDNELVQLKRRHIDGGSDLHREFFDLFHRFLVQEAPEHGASLTPGELMAQLVKRASAPDAEVIRRLADEWERLVYARMSPARSFAGVEQDARTILKWARTQENRS